MAYTNKAQPTEISPIQFIKTQENVAVIPDCLYSTERDFLN